MNKETKLLAVIIITFIFSIHLVVEKSFQPIFPNINEENNNKKYFSNFKIIEKNADKEVNDEIKLLGEEQISIKPSEYSKNNDDDKITIKNEVKERNTNLKIINSNMNKNQSK